MGRSNYVRIILTCLGNEQGEMIASFVLPFKQSRLTYPREEENFSLPIREWHKKKVSHDCYIVLEAFK